MSETYIAWEIMDASDQKFGYKNSVKPKLQNSTECKLTLEWWQKNIKKASWCSFAADMELIIGQAIATKLKSTANFKNQRECNRIINADKWKKIAFNVDQPGTTSRNYVTLYADNPNYRNGIS